MVSPRRSPRLKGPSPKPELPRRPKPPKRVKDVAEDSVRQANFKLELAAWEAEKVEHAKRMKIRKATATASWKAANKSVGKDAAPSTCHLAHLACTSLTPLFAPVCAGAQLYPGVVATSEIEALVQLDRCPHLCDNRGYCVRAAGREAARCKCYPPAKHK